MRTNRFWENRYNDFCDKVLGEEIRRNQSFMDAVMNEILWTEEFFNESIDSSEEKAKEAVLFCYINHELNLLDPIGVCYPQIIDEYSSYAWGMVEALLAEGKESFPELFKVRLRAMYSSVHSPLGKKLLDSACRKITNTINEIYDSLEFVQSLHRDQFSSIQFWKKQMTNYQYLVLAEKRKEYAAAVTFLQEERNQLLHAKEENMAGNAENYIQFLYINHCLNLLEPAKMYYPQFPYHFEKYAHKLLQIYKNNKPRFHIEAEKIIAQLYEEEGCNWKGKQVYIRDSLMEMEKYLKGFSQP